MEKINEEDASDPQNYFIFSEKLPVPFVEDEVLEKSPELVKLLESLSNYISPRGIKHDNETEIIDAEEALDFQKERWLRAKLLLDTVHEIIEDKEVAETSSNEDFKFVSAVKSSLQSAECCSYLHCHPDHASDVTLFDLNDADILSSKKYNSDDFSIKKLSHEVRTKLDRKLLLLMQYYQPTDSHIPAEKSKCFSSLISGDVSRLRQQQQLAKEEQKVTQKLLRMYHEVLVKSIQVVEQMIGTYKLKFQHISDKTYCDWLIAKGEGLMLKLKKMELERLYYTYCQDNNETAKALSTIDKEIDKRIEKKASDLENVEKLVETYQSVGMGFDELVQDYASLKEHYSTQKWALDDLAKNI